MPAVNDLAAVVLDGSLDAPSRVVPRIPSPEHLALVRVGHAVGAYKRCQHQIKDERTEMIRLSHSSTWGRDLCRPENLKSAT